MSRVIMAQSVSNGLAMALYSLRADHDVRESRNGAVLAFRYPVLTEYEMPWRRVLFSPVRNANPFFHLMEALWMLAGRNDVWFPASFVPRMGGFSDDGKTLYGAYGHRWLFSFGFDQIRHAAHMLKKDPTSRRSVVAMWNSGAWSPHGNTSDSIAAATGGKDVPCNTHMYFDRRDGKLNMTVCCRSNDIIWGCYGANAVHFSILLEFMAAMVGCEMGVYRQFSNDLHLYPSNMPRDFDMELLENDLWGTDLYAKGLVTHMPLIDSANGETCSDFMQDLTTMFETVDLIRVCDVPLRPNVHRIHQTDMYRTRFLKSVVVPMLQMWGGHAGVESGGNEDNDWIVAGTQHRARSTARLRGVST